LGQEHILPFIFTGFRQTAGSRVFAFESSPKDQMQTKLTVRADIGLGRKHGIHLQDWPLLCVEMIEGRADDIKPGSCELIFDEARMRERADARTAMRLSALLKKKKTYKPVTNTHGAFAAAV